MPHRQIVKDTIFIIQSALLAAVVVWVTVATKPSDVYRRIDAMELRILDGLGNYVVKVNETKQSVESVEVWIREATTEINGLRKRLDVIENKTADRWTRSDHQDWEQRRFGDVIGEDEEKN